MRPTPSTIILARGYGSRPSPGRRVEGPCHANGSALAAPMTPAPASSRRSPDPYSPPSLLRNAADAFNYHPRQGLWVPAFAGTTGGGSVPCEWLCPCGPDDASPRVVPAFAGPILPAVAFAQCGRRLQLSSSPGVMGPGLRRDDGWRVRALRMVLPL